MAEEDSGQEKTEEPTGKRLDKAREEGQIPRSKELTTTALLMASALTLLLLGKSMSDQLQAMIKKNFSVSREDIFEYWTPVKYLGQSFQDAFWTVLPLFAVLFFAVSASTLMLGGFLFSTKAFAPKISRLDPIAGIKRMFSMKSLVELVKAIAKFLLVLSVALLILNGLKADIMSITNATLYAAMAKSVHIVLGLGLALAVTTILISVIDVPFQIYDHKKQLKMTMQQVKDELKDTEGKPEVKGKIRQLQREMAQSRMMGDVPDADVVITNPTHYSVALTYDPMKPGAPVVVAKGTDFIALKIREIATAHDVLMVEAPPLARAVYYTTEVRQEIPTELYNAVAQVLAYVYQLRRFKDRKGERPNALGDLDLPPDMIFDD